MRVTINQTEIIEAIIEWLAKRNLKASDSRFERSHGVNWLEIEDVRGNFAVEPIEVKDHPYR